jgi:hypothetical protein
MYDLLFGGYILPSFSRVIACDKRKAFAQVSDSDDLSAVADQRRRKQSIAPQVARWIASLRSQ